MLGLVWEITERITTTTTTTVNCFYSPRWSGFEMDLVVAQLQHSGAVSNPRVYSITVLYYLHSSSAFLFWFHPIKTDSFAGTKRDGTQPTHTPWPPQLCAVFITPGDNTCCQECRTRSRNRKHQTGRTNERNKICQTRGAWDCVSGWWLACWLTGLDWTGDWDKDNEMKILANDCHRAPSR